MSRTNRLEGDAVLAHQQTKGRGRHGRLWESNRDDGMYLSLALRPKREVREWPTLSFVSALSLLQALQTRIELPNAGLNWPNDILVNGQNQRYPLRLSSKKCFLDVANLKMHL